MKMLFAALAFTVVACAPAAAPPQFEHLDECSNPVMESNFWLVLEGTVAGIEPDGSLRITNVTSNRDPVAGDRTVPLVTVQVVDDSWLRTLIGKRVTMSSPFSMLEQDHVPVVLFLDDRNVNRTLLANGQARYVQPPPYSISNYENCLHRIAEREAKVKGLGIWKR